MISDPAKSSYIGIFYDPKLGGEANHRPQQRIPPLRAEPLRRLVEIARSRLGADVQDDELPDGDLYFLFDGGRSGNHSELLKPFTGKPKSVKTFMLWRDEDSLTQRLSRVKGGITAYQQHESLLIVSAAPGALKGTKFPNYKGSSAGSMMGPIILPDLSGMWQATWAVKKDIFTAANLIAVGGRIDGDDEASADDKVKAKPREKDTVEPVFFHALPESFYTELIATIPLCVVLDLTPGDGALAMSCYKKGIVYVGLPFSDAHKTALQAHLAKCIWQAMSTDPVHLADCRQRRPSQSQVASTQCQTQMTPAPMTAKLTHTRVATWQVCLWSV